MERTMMDQAAEMTAIHDLKQRACSDFIQTAQLLISTKTATVHP